MDSILFESVSKVFRHRPALFNWIGKERRGETYALQDVSLSATPGEVLVILGPNGSGKTTLLKLVSTMLLPDTGRVLVGGVDTLENPQHVGKQIGFAVATERSFFPRLTARENLDFFATLEDVSRSRRVAQVEAALASTELLDAADTLVMKFSSGMYQKLGIARALLKNPSVLLLDEATRSLDPGTTMRIWKMFRETAARGTTVIVTTHRFDEALAVGDSVAVLHRGSLAAKKRLEDATSKEDLHDFYFRNVGEHYPTAELVWRGAL